MSTNWDEYQKRVTEDSKGNDLSAYADFLESVPLLSQGMVSPLKKGSEEGSVSVTIFFEQGRFKAAISAKKHGTVAFYTFDDLTKPFEDLEAAMKEDRLEWRNSRRRG